MCMVLKSLHVYIMGAVVLSLSISPSLDFLIEHGETYRV